MLCIFQEDIERVSICAIDIYFTEHVKLYIIAFGKFLNLFIWTWFLSSKLVARESKDTKTFFSIPVILRIKIKKIIRIICLIFNIFEFLPLLVTCNELTRITYIAIFLGPFCPRGKGAWGYPYVKHQPRRNNTMDSHNTGKLYALHYGKLFGTTILSISTGFDTMMSPGLQCIINLCRYCAIMI